MIDEPVQKASGISMKSNWALDHKINSSEKRDKCIMIKLAAAVNSIAKSRSLTESRELAEGRLNPSSFWEVVA
jgi:hypothetical protein